MQTVELTDVYKASAEVASLGSSDRVLVADSNGVQKRIKSNGFVNPSKSGGYNSPQWIRLFSSGSTASLFILEQNYYNSPGGCIIVNVCNQKDSANHCSAQALSALYHSSTYKCFGKLRVVGTSSELFVDYYYPHSVYNNIYLTLMSKYGTFSLLMENNPTIPAGAWVKEFDLSTVNSTATVFGGGG